MRIGRLLLLQRIVETSIEPRAPPPPLKTSKTPTPPLKTSKTPTLTPTLTPTPPIHIRRFPKPIHPFQKSELPNHLIHDTHHHHTRHIKKCFIPTPHTICGSAGTLSTACLSSDSIDNCPDDATLKTSNVPTYHQRSFGLMGSSSTITYDDENDDDGDNNNGGGDHTRRQQQHGPCHSRILSEPNPVLERLVKKLNLTPSKPFTLPKSCNVSTCSSLAHPREDDDPRYHQKQ